MLINLVIVYMQGGQLFIVILFFLNYLLYNEYSLVQDLVPHGNRSV